MTRGSKAYRERAATIAERAEAALEMVDELREEMLAAARLKLEEGVDVVAPPDELLPRWITSHYGSLIHECRTRFDAINDARTAAALVAGHMRFLAERAQDD